ncbi:MAG: hypothetical protein WBC18_07150 [Ottowia sp.]|uniref:hypothetical protein n=1 Tax=Ottowia sp. TaxID=1898956 RepID=UPI003C75AB4D
MNWITRFLLGHWNYILGGLLLFTVLISGIQIGQTRVQRAWDAEKQQAALIQAKQEQHVADTLYAQKTINQEISNEFQTKKSLLAALRPAFRRSDVGLRVQSSQDPGTMPIVPAAAAGIAAAPADVVPDSAGLATGISCEQLARDAAETTLMVLELQQWHARQSVADAIPAP